METTAHFENIPQEIARRLAAATQEIVVAVAWFTDRDLFDVLCKQAGRGLGSVSPSWTTASTSVPAASTSPACRTSAARSS